jgi:mannan endo-1,4-beta-mannosidase
MSGPQTRSAWRVLIVLAALAGLACADEAVDATASGERGDAKSDHAVARATDTRRPTLYTEGRFLYDREGRQIVLRGINKMSIYDAADPNGVVYMPEIRKTGANTVRIVWKTVDWRGNPSSLAQLDALITAAHAQQLVPMVELHDTNRLQDLPTLVAFWTRADVVALVAKHQSYLLVNIGNELGDDRVTAPQFIAAYAPAVAALRSAGILPPLVIDAPDFGKNLDVLDQTAAALLAVDPLHNLLFSVHLYWSISCGADAAFLRHHLEESVALGYPLVVGEFSKYGGWPCQGVGTSMCQPAAEVDYHTILEVTYEHAIGWYVWEWGPGNAYNDPLCAVMDLTPDGLAASLAPGWADEVIRTSPYGIASTSKIVPNL